MTKEEAKKWGLILLSYGFGDKCDIVVKEKGLNTEPISNLYVVDSGDHTVNEDDYKILERTSPACPPGFSINPIHFEYEEKEDKNFISKIIKFQKNQMFEIAKTFIKAALSSESTKSDYFKIGRVEKKNGF